MKVIVFIYYCVVFLVRYLHLRVHLSIDISTLDLCNEVIDPVNYMSRLYAFNLHVA